MPKTIAFGTKPESRITARNPDDWVRDVESVAPAQTLPNSELTNEPMKRLTIDVSENLHRRIKMACARDGLKIADEVRSLLEKRFGDVPL